MVFIRRDESDWRTYVTIARAGLIAFALLFSLLKVGLCQTKITQQPQTEKPQAKPYVLAQITSVSQVATQYEPHCDKPATREDAEYCDEWSAAVATQKQAEWALCQLIASVIGIGAVAATLFYTAQAVRASQRSAMAAEAAVTAMKEIDKRQGEDVKASIFQAGRAADAMSDVGSCPTPWCRSCG